MLARVRALLAKAESTPFEAEAEALTAKAQELMARYAITEAMLDAQGGRCGGPERRDMVLEPPYVSAKAMLLGVIARANRCQVVWTNEPPRAAVFGYPADLRATEVLYTSLLVQVSRALAASGPVRDVTGTSRTRSYRRSFLLGFASRVGERLREVAAATADEVASDLGVSLVPVMADRAVQIRAAVAEAFPHTSPQKSAIGNGKGFMAGRAAGDRAALTPDARAVRATARLPR
jgi:hypothetical protein